MLSLDEKNFEKEVLKENTPVVIDFHAEWCGSCKAVSRTIEELEEEFGKKIKFCEIDIGKKSEFAGKYNITSLPTILFMKQGKEVARKNGSTTKPEFKELIQKIM